MALKPVRIDDLTPHEYQSLMKRSQVDITSVHERVRDIIRDVRDKGEGVFLDYYRAHYKPGLKPQELEAGRDEIQEAYENVHQELVDALRYAAGNISKFHDAQMDKAMWQIEIAEGILAGRLITPLQRVGVYIPGGRAPYPSSVLMTLLPAKAAGVKDIIICTPPHEAMAINPAILVAADIAGPVRIFKVGGPWAIAAMAYGTRTIPKVDKIVGPGNIYVTAAKLLVFGEVDIDSPAGPSEGMVLADQTGNPDFIAIDLLSQAEHDPDSAVVLVTTSEDLASTVSDIIREALPQIPRKEIVTSSVTRYSHILIARDMEQAIGFVNEYAPEHLEIMTEEPFATLKKIRNAGSIFMGPFSPISAGDYASGTNHVLPTGQKARMFSGLSVDEFVKKPTFQHVSKEGLSLLKDAVVTLARAEGLPLHARAVMERFK
ncbi:MAG: histidinol dehydrogenase [Deltaproteobacteria bacterium]|nr:histidinol dehydrogenase [Deltaproteobacteria bacterium]MBW2077144.1 histidinol dehydrogenase [Deltaproteobacteria bacterium]